MSCVVYLLPVQSGHRLWVDLWVDILMAKHQRLLNHRAILAAKKPGMYRDSDGLFLQITPPGVKSWVLRYMFDGRARYMGLGPFPTVGIADARDEAARVRRDMLSAGLDPLENRAAEERRRKLERAKSLSFKACSEAFIQSNRSGWSNEKHVWQWTRSLELYVYPLIGDIPVADVDTTLLMRILEPVWTTTTETAARIRGRIERVLGYATTAGFRSGENPARWKGHLENLLPKPSRVRRVTNQPALPWREVPVFFASLSKIETLSARALEFTILTAARTNETLRAEWPEMNIKGGVWTIPANRIKARREHRVPLSKSAIKILSRLDEVQPSPKRFVFPGIRRSKPLSDMSMLMTLRRMSYLNITTHGFRSSFRDWAAEETDTPREVAEMALAHVVESKVEAAYRRGDLFEKRTDLMSQWDAYCFSNRLTV
jgi:integrase